ncbi:MAG: hypothetical protein AAGA75_14230 [Cyanobacteria bacterium P01_E01_bin.6]
MSESSDIAITTNDDNVVMSGDEFLAVVMRLAIYDLALSMSGKHNLLLQQAYSQFQGFSEETRLKHIERAIDLMQMAQVTDIEDGHEVVMSFPKAGGVHG